MSAAPHMDADARLQLLTRWLLVISNVPGHIIMSTADAKFRGSTLDLSNIPAAAARLLAESEKSDTYLRATTTSRPIDDGGRGMSSDTEAAFGLWADLDHATGVHKPPPSGLPLPQDIDACLAIIAPLPDPTLIIDSSGGLQAWWLFTEPVTAAERADLEDLVERWGQHMVQLGRNRGVHVDMVGDLARILRPPGTLNHKWAKRNEPPRVVTVHANSGARYSVDELMSWVPEPEEEPEPANTSKAASSSDNDHHDIERWESDTDWSAILEPHGWKLHRRFSDGVREWTRPGADKETSPRSAVTDYDGKPTMVVHSAAAGLPSGPKKKLTKFRVWAQLNHHGDLKAASAAIRKTHGPNLEPRLVAAPGQTAPTEEKAADGEPLIVAAPGAPHINAARFVRDVYTHNDQTILAHHGGVWHAWDGTCWPEVETGAVVKDLYEFFSEADYKDKDGESKPFNPTRTKVNDLLHAMQAVCFVSSDRPAPQWLDRRAAPAADEVIACRNGLLHWPSRTLHKHTPAYWTHHSVPFDYDPQATAAPQWNAFLNQLWGDDQEAIACLQEICGYLLSGDTRQQKIFLLIGPPRSGKGTIARVITKLIGAHNVAGPTLAGIGQNFGLQNLIGKPLATIADARLRTSQEVITERLLSISGEDPMTVDRKFREPWTGKLPTRFLVLSNELPNLNDASGALASRFILLTTSRSFLGEEDPGLTDRLTAELPAILNWSLDGLERLRNRGRFFVPESSREAMEELEELGSPMSAFVRERCIVEPGRSIEVSQLYRAWRDWCDRVGRDHTGTQQRFGRDLRAAVPGVSVTRRRGDDGRARHYEGIALDVVGEVPM